MSENEGGNSRFMTGFTVGFVVGVLLCLGVGGSLAVVQVSRSQAELKAALSAEREARMVAEAARRSAEVARRRAEDAAKATADKAKP